MNDYLSNLAARTLNAAGTIQPRRASMFEPNAASLDDSVSRRLAEEDADGIDTATQQSDQDVRATSMPRSAASAGLARNAAPAPAPASSLPGDLSPQTDAAKTLAAKRQRPPVLPPDTTAASPEAFESDAVAPQVSADSASIPPASPAPRHTRLQPSTGGDPRPLRTATDGATGPPGPVPDGLVVDGAPTNHVTGGLDNAVNESAESAALVAPVVGGDESRSLTESLVSAPATPQIVPRAKVAVTLDETKRRVVEDHADTAAPTDPRETQQFGQGEHASPVIRVTIGRVEVRAVAPAPAPAPAPSSGRDASLSLEEYLKQLEGDRR